MCQKVIGVFALISQQRGGISADLCIQLISLQPNTLQISSNFFVFVCVLFLLSVFFFFVTFHQRRPVIIIRGGIVGVGGQSDSCWWSLRQGDICLLDSDHLGRRRTWMPLWLNRVHLLYPQVFPVITDQCVSRSHVLLSAMLNDAVCEQGYSAAITASVTKEEKKHYRRQFDLFKPSEIFLFHKITFWIWIKCKCH